MQQDAEGLRLLVTRPDGTWTIRRLAVEDLEREDGKPLVKISDKSPMPDVAKILSAEELEALIAFLRSLQSI